MRRAIPTARIEADRNLRIFSCISCLKNLELYFDVNCNWDGLAVEGSRLKAILADCIHGRFVKSSIAGTDDVNIYGNAVDRDSKPNKYLAGFR